MGKQEGDFRPNLPCHSAGKINVEACRLAVFIKKFKRRKYAVTTINKHAHPFAFMISCTRLMVFEFSVDTARYAYRQSKCAGQRQEPSVEWGRHHASGLT